MNVIRHLRVPIAAAVCAASLAGGAAVAATAPTHDVTQATGAHRSDSARRVACHGTAAECTARVNIAGGASNQRVVIQLPAAGMRVESVKPTSRKLDGGYLISEQRMLDGGRQYAFVLNSVEAPRGSALTFTFRSPSRTTPMIVRCHGGSPCRAVVPIASGASNRRVIVQLPRTDLGLVAVKPSSRDLRGAYSLSRQKLRAGGSEYTFVLNAVESAPAGSHLTLTFA